MTNSGSENRTKKAQVKTMTQMKAILLNSEDQGPARKKNYNKFQDEASQEEKDFYSKVKDNDKIMDEKAAKIAEGANILKD